MIFCSSKRSSKNGGWEKINQPCSHGVIGTVVFWYDTNPVRNKFEGHATSKLHARNFEVAIVFLDWVEVLRICDTQLRSCVHTTSKLCACNFEVAWRTPIHAISKLRYFQICCIATLNLFAPVIKSNEIRILPIISRARSFCLLEKLHCMWRPLRVTHW